MKIKAIPSLSRSWLWLAATAFLPMAMHAATPNWEAFHDYGPDVGTSPSASRGMLRTAGQTYVLLNIATGEELAAVVTAETEGGTPDDFGARGGAPAVGSPAHLLFDGKVDLSNGGLPGVRQAVKLTLAFTGLDPAKRYTFCGFVSRGGNYNNRWSVHSLVANNIGVAAHKDASANRNIFTAATFPAAAESLAANQVALNSGHNKEGSLVCWEQIEPMEDGSVRVESLRYMGPTPFGDAPNAGTSYAYGFEAFYLAEFEATGNLRITENPSSLKVPAGTKAAFSVVASSPDPIQYQWQSAAAGTEDFQNIPGATSETYTTPNLTVSSDGISLRCVVTSGANTAISGVATLNVDGTLPLVEGVNGSVNGNALFVKFSEAMNLDTIAADGNYKITGLDVIVATVVDATTVRLSTSQQTWGSAHTLTLNGLRDVAGNAIAPNTKVEFVTYSLVNGVVGMEIWKNIGGGAVADLRNNARYLEAPDLDYAIATLDSTIILQGDTLNTFGGRFRAFLKPDTTGEYEFFLAGDDQAELRLSLDGSFDNIESPEANAPIAVVTAASAVFQEPGLNGSVSAPIALEAGVTYALQALWKESNGSELCKVGWRLVGDPTPVSELPTIPSQFLSYYGPGGTTANVQTITAAGGQVTITYTGTTLESSTDLVTWTAVTGATSPYTIAATGTRFFRAR